MLQPVGVYLNCGMGFRCGISDPYQPCIIRSLSPDAFFETIDYEKYRKMEKTVDQIRKRFGMDSIKRACFLPSAGSVEIDHMGGGVSREKRTVDYSQEKIL